MRHTIIVPPEIIPKPPLKYEELRDIIDLSLWAGQLLLHFGAESQRIEETVHRLGTGLGCDWMDILVSPNALVVTTSSAGEFRTKVRRVVGLGVNMNIVDEVNTLSRRVWEDKLDRFQVREELERISHTPPHYNRWLVVVMVGLACAAFSRMFGGDFPIFCVTFVASAAAMVVRQELHIRYFNPLLEVIAASFVAGLIASSATFFSDEPQIALTAAVLLLVPGVPFINAAEDLIQGHMVTGLVRGVIGGIISLALALGLLIAMQITGVGGL